MKWYRIGWLGLAIFLVIACSYNTQPMKKLDRWASHTFEGNDFLSFFHIIGEPKVIIVLTIVFSIIVVITKKAWKAALMSILAVAVGYGINQGLKGVFERPRPDVVDQLTSYSFPSAHAMGTTICLLIIVFLCQQVFYKGNKLYAGYVLVTGVIILVSLSRVAEARHFFTDITAGISLGVAIVVCIASMYKKWSR